MTSLCMSTRPLLPCSPATADPCPPLHSRQGSRGAAIFGLPIFFVSVVTRVFRLSSLEMVGKNCTQRLNGVIDTSWNGPTISWSQLRAGRRLGCDRGPSKWRALVGQGPVSGRTSPRPSTWTANAREIEVPAKPAICYRSTHTLTLSRLATQESTSVKNSVASGEPVKFALLGSRC
jgi:hypothetical protein